MKFAVESWDPAYGASSREGDESRTARPVDASVEVPAASWKPIDPPIDAQAPDQVVFVDGVRRIDARLWITGDDEGPARPGVCATVAAGVIRCSPLEAVVDTVVVRRGLYTSAPTAEPVIDLIDGYRLEYEVRPLVDDEGGDTGGDGGGDEAVYLAVHNHMTEVELELSGELTHDDMVVFDGPLDRRDHPNSVGYIKTQHVHYLDPELRSTIANLEAGQRTPVFRVGGQWPVWSWYLRLPGPVAHSMSGIVRLEIPALGDVTDAAERAGEVMVTLPRFASEAHKEARAPQNLYPISGLERQLRRHLGDPGLLERALRVRAQRSLVS